MASWYYVRDNQRVGPVSLEELLVVLQSGQLRPEDRAWTEGMADWMPISAIPALQAAASNVFSSQGGAVSALAGMSTAATDPNALGYQSKGTGGVMASARAIDFLRQTAPWVRFLGILMFVGAGFMLLGGCLITAFGMNGNAGPNAVVGIVYIILSPLYIMPGIFLNRYATHIRSVVAFRQPTDLESAIEAQKSFWKFMGIMMIVVLAVYAVMLIIGIVAIVLLGSRGRPF